MMTINSLNLAFDCIRAWYTVSAETGILAAISQLMSPLILNTFFEGTVAYSANLQFDFTPTIPPFLHSIS